MKITHKTAAIFALILVTSLPVWAQEKSSPEEVITMVRKAADYLAETGEAGIAEFNDKGSQWVWKDTYIFVIDCKNGKMLAHPFSKKLLSKQLLGLTDVKGNLIFVNIYEAAKNPTGGWAEYWWNKPGKNNPARKISFVLNVPGHLYQVGAGIYDEAIPVEQLQKMTLQE